MVVVYTVTTKSGQAHSTTHDTEAPLVPDLRDQLASGVPFVELQSRPGVGMLVGVDSIESLDWRPAPVKKEEKQGVTVN